jgi:hypothetical protein
MREYSGCKAAPFKIPVLPTMLLGMLLHRAWMGAIKKHTSLQ